MHVLRNHKLNRRTVLRGSGAAAAIAVGLPALEIMLNPHGDALAGGGELPRRFVSFMFGNGVQLANWEPSTTGPNWSAGGVPSLLQPLVDANVVDYVNICTGMQNRFGGSAITHHEGMSIFSGYDFVLRPDLPGFASDWGGPTIDQVIADAVVASGAGLPIRSIQCGLTKFDSPADNGATAKAVSARGEPGALTVLYPEQNPVEVWDSIFGEFTSIKDDREVRLSVLDAVAEEAARLKLKLGVKDNQRVDAHLQGISELQTKISALPPACDIIDSPTHENTESNGSEDLVLVNQIMSELIATAFACDVTRVASNMVLSPAGETVLGDIGNSGSQHGNSHANNQEYHDGIQFIIARYAQLLAALRDTPDGAGNLLDSSIVFCSSELSQGASHSWQRQPILIGGHANGYLEYPGIHYQAVPQSNPNDDLTSAGNTSDILLTMLRAFDSNAASVGGGAQVSSSVLSEIMA
ncbi:MAG: DUF1552 domain-containing protein [Nannocystaceae bacterium]|nr:DUF1552 domain-containing protein [Nannocystaceae bacterium]